MGKRSKARRRQGDPLDGEGTGTSDEETGKSILIASSLSLRGPYISDFYEQKVECCALHVSFFSDTSENGVLPPVN